MNATSLKVTRLVEAAQLRWAFCNKAASLQEHPCHRNNPGSRGDALFMEKYGRSVL